MRILPTTVLFALAFSPLAGANTPFSSGFADSPSDMMPDSRCNLSLGAPVIDYGNQTRWQLNESSSGRNHVTPGKRTIMVNVVCPYTQAIRLTLRGAQAANGDLRYGEQGSVRIHLSDAQLDGQSVSVAHITPSGVLSGSQSSLQLKPDQSFAATVNGQLTKGKTLTVRLDIEPELQTKDAQVSSLQVNESNLRLELMR
ncbi:DUF1120 domain-containing protein [Serratia sp. D1N4]